MIELRASELFKALRNADEASWALHGQDLALERAAVLLWLATPAVWASADKAPELAVCDLSSWLLQTRTVLCATGIIVPSAEAASW